MAGIIDFPKSELKWLNAGDLQKSVMLSQYKNGKRQRGWEFYVEDKDDGTGGKKYVRSLKQMMEVVEFIKETPEIEEEKKDDLYFALDVAQVKNKVKTYLKSKVYLELRIETVVDPNYYPVSASIVTDGQVIPLLSTKPRYILDNTADHRKQLDLCRELTGDPKYDRTDQVVTKNFDFLQFPELFTDRYKKWRDAMNGFDLPLFWPDDQEPRFWLDKNWPLADSLEIRMGPDYAFSDSVAFVASLYHDLPQDIDIFERMRFASKKLDAIHQTYHPNSQVELFVDYHDRFIEIFEKGRSKYLKELEKMASLPDEGEIRREAVYRAWQEEEAERKRKEAEAYDARKLSEDQPPRKRQRSDDARARLLATSLLKHHDGDVEAVARMMAKINF